MLRIKFIRLEQGLGQRETAAKLGFGLSTYALLESGRLRPTAAQLALLRRSFGSETETLFEPVQERVGVAP